MATPKKRQADKHIAAPASEPITNTPIVKTTWLDVWLGDRGAWATNAIAREQNRVMLEERTRTQASASRLSPFAINTRASDDDNENVLSSSKKTLSAKPLPPNSSARIPVTAHRVAPTRPVASTLLRSTTTTVPQLVETPSLSDSVEVREKHVSSLPKNNGWLRHDREIIAAAAATATNDKTTTSASTLNEIPASHLPYLAMIRIIGQWTMPTLPELPKIEPFIIDCLPPRRSDNAKRFHDDITATASPIAEPPKKTKTAIVLSDSENEEASECEEVSETMIDEEEEDEEDGEEGDEEIGDEEEEEDEEDDDYDENDSLFASYDEEEEEGEEADDDEEDDEEGSESFSNDSESDEEEKVQPKPLKKRKLIEECEAELLMY